MKIVDADSVLVDGKPTNVAIVERRDGNSLRLRFPYEGPTWDWIDRSRVQAVGEAIAAACSRGTKYSNSLSFANAVRLSLN
jgi:hypothetical protein